MLQIGLVQQTVQIVASHDLTLLVRFSGVNGYRFVFGGLVWTYIVSSNKLSANIQDGFLQDDGRAIVLMKKLAEFPDLMLMGNKLHAQGKLRERVHTP